MNLLMMAPLLDSRGNLRYFIGAQVDVSGLVKDCTGLDAFKNYVDVKEGRAAENEPKDEFQELSEMFNTTELDMVKRYGGSMHKEHVVEEEDSNRSRAVQRPRLLIKDSGNFENASLGSPTAEGRLSGVYKHVSAQAQHLRLMLTQYTVSTHPSSAFVANSLRLTLSPCTRNIAIALLGSHWRK